MIVKQRICKTTDDEKQSLYRQGNNDNKLTNRGITSVFQKGLRSGFAICKQNLLTLDRMTSIWICFCGRHIGRTQHTEIPTRPNQTVTFVEICLYVYHIVVFEFDSVTEVHVDIYH